jgi:predicted regulator of amino acid metabolism with ACT domain
MEILNLVLLFQNISNYVIEHSTFQFSEDDILLNGINDMTTLALTGHNEAMRQILQDRYTGKVAGFNNVRVRDNSVVGEFYDTMSPFRTARYKFFISPKRVEYSIIDQGGYLPTGNDYPDNRNDPDKADFSTPIVKKVCPPGKKACKIKNGFYRCVPEHWRCADEKAAKGGLIQHERSRLQSTRIKGKTKPTPSEKKEIESIIATGLRVDQRKTRVKDKSRRSYRVASVTGEKEVGVVKQRSLLEGMFPDTRNVPSLDRVNESLSLINSKTSNVNSNMRVVEGGSKNKNRSKAQLEIVNKPIYVQDSRHSYKIDSSGAIFTLKPGDIWEPATALEKARLDKSKKENRLQLSGSRDHLEQEPDSLFKRKLLKGDIQGAIDQTILSAQNAREDAEKAKNDIQSGQNALNALTEDVLDKYPTLGNPYNPHAYKSDRRTKGFKQSYNSNADQLVMDEEDYLSAKGASKYDVGEPALHRQPRSTEKSRKTLADNQLKKDIALGKKRSRLSDEYNNLVNTGIIRKPTYLEKRLATAQGHDDNESVQSARRILEKRGVDWKTARLTPSGGLLTHEDTSRTTSDNTRTYATVGENTRRENEAMGSVSSSFSRDIPYLAKVKTFTQQVKAALAAEVLGNMENDLIKEMSKTSNKLYNYALSGNDEEIIDSNAARLRLLPPDTKFQAIGKVLKGEYPGLDGLSDGGRINVARSLAQQAAESADTQQKGKLYGHSHALKDLDTLRDDLVSQGWGEHSRQSDNQSQLLDALLSKGGGRTKKSNTDSSEVKRLKAMSSETRKHLAVLVPLKESMQQSLDLLRTEYNHNPDYLTRINGVFEGAFGDTPGLKALHKVLNLMVKHDIDHELPSFKTLVKSYVSNSGSTNKSNTLTRLQEQIDYLQERHDESTKNSETLKSTGSGNLKKSDADNEGVKRLEVIPVETKKHDGQARVSDNKKITNKQFLMAYNNARRVQELNGVVAIKPQDIAKELGISTEHANTIVEHLAKEGHLFIVKEMKDNIMQVADSGQSLNNNNVIKVKAPQSSAKASGSKLSETKKKSPSVKLSDKQILDAYKEVRRQQELGGVVAVSPSDLAHHLGIDSDVVSKKVDQLIKSGKFYTDDEDNTKGSKKLIEIVH